MRNNRLVGEKRWLKIVEPLGVVLLVLLIIISFCLSACAQNVGNAVDLGLSVKWAGQNVGAKSPSDYGTYLAWAETESKTKYWFDTYKYTDAKECEQCLVDLGESICGTEYDMARQLWKGEWRLPTDKEILELRNNCSWEWTQQDGVNGFLITGPNGNSIFLPAGGYISGENKQDVGSTCSYWGGTKSFIRNAHTIWANYDKEDESVSIKCWGDYRPMGRLVRPVMDR